MRPQIVTAVAFSMTVVLLAYISLRSSQSSQLSPKNRTGSITSSRARTFFSFQTPFTLFPPNALITLTHDNTTSFLARPAAFGPDLPNEGLKGQVWIGSGFGEYASGGEQGCSDVLGWSTSSTDPNSDSSDRKVSADASSRQRSNVEYLPRTDHEDESSEIPFTQSNSFTGISEAILPANSDLTDDYLHYSSSASTLSKSNPKDSTQASENHANIQSLQETAEIAGKIVLLSRGGCGFLEKVKWSQRRGAVALIVGDNTKGGSLIQMFARGDTNSVTIPSVFTSYTTAQLLCSLVTTPSLVRRRNVADGYPTSEKNNSTTKGEKTSSHPRITSDEPQKTSKSKLAEENRPDSRFNRVLQAITTKNSGWFGFIYSSNSNMDSKFERSRPPSSGQLDWVVDNSEIETLKTSKLAESTEYFDSTKFTKFLSTSKKPEEKKFLDDNFVIGVQDWRDPDLLDITTSKDLEEIKEKPSSVSSTKQEDTKENTDLYVLQKKQKVETLQTVPKEFSKLKGEIITPSSGEYIFEYRGKNLGEKSTKNLERNRELSSKDFLSAVFDDERMESGALARTKRSSGDLNSVYELDDEEYEGLWITLSPSAGASPFLDTLLVLIVSPLVTLTIIYALLMVRSRYRQHRWRAPKSVVERLPVRTYQTINSSGSFSPRIPNLQGLSVTTPLLQDASKSPCRFQTSSFMSNSSGLFCKSTQTQDNLTRDSNHEKIVSESTTWKKQTRTQVECVVCLEEYVDGVSRIMGLPCGHEFHVDCITPWLTTRRRTCPICKGDVVRSMARSNRYGLSRNDSDDDDEENDLGEMVHIVNSNSSSRILTNLDSHNDIGQDSSAGAPHRPGQVETSSWRGLLAGNFASIIWNLGLARENRSP